MASLGAEVIKVETNKVLDEMAFIPAWSRGAGQPDFQRIKKRVSIDVRTEGGLDVFRELVKVSDVFMTNFRRNILDRWGIDFPAVRQLRPDIILMWQTGLGGIGPYYTYKSYGILVQHMGGVSLMTGEEPEAPIGAQGMSTGSRPPTINGGYALRGLRRFCERPWRTLHRSVPYSKSRRRPPLSCARMPGRTGMNLSPWPWFRANCQTWLAACARNAAIPACCASAA